MTSQDQLSTPEQAKPRDILPTAGDETSSESPSIAPTFAKPEEIGDESDRPAVNPVTGGAV
ncbi:hypothetical protein ASG25_00070 [Rhizobium sp. Leaf384]|uniref:hypothetical protein n=1 Tax=unclassified Rhizobium TaxID=2613769 RepID=UPI000713FCCF|nr:MULTISPECIES: hypothetical protein [unclassified Rhizobium]KQR67802.1 hypothetical protein ASG03_09690 [Rhizobium sp. Leaf341]KQS74365.1 hypothetical protein ASG58_15265 [Rhizobium sp. Leaf383]KQS80104.1 hypothetical protein ASG25_00070 [Rhizobium sp. Leaf384]